VRRAFRIFVILALLATALALPVSAQEAVDQLEPSPHRVRPKPAN
jgi:hypothetical protein